MSAEYDEYRALIGAHKYQEAADLAGAEVEKGRPGSAFWSTQEAGALNRAGKFTAAYEAAGEALRREPANPYAVLAAGDALWGLGRVEEALDHYREAARDERLSNRAEWKVLRSLERLKRWDELLERAARSRLSERAVLPWTVKALAATERQEEALQACERWLQAEPHDRHALWERTNLEIARDGLDVVLERMRKLARISSLPAIYREIYASLCRQAGKLKEAAAAYRSLEGTEAQRKAQQQQAFMAARDGREEEAIPLLEELLRAEPANRFLHASYAAACRRSGRAAEAINFYNELLTMYPEQKGLYGRISRMRHALESSS